MLNLESTVQNIQSQLTRRPVAVDLFAGAGGFSLGIEQAGFDVLVAVEYDPIHACTYSFNFPLTEVLRADVSIVTGEMIKEAAYRSWVVHREKNKETWQNSNHKRVEKWDGQIDLVFGGPPCQGFSIMGKRELEDDRNNLIFHFYRLVMELNPRYFVMENVPGIAAGEHKNLLMQLISKFEAAGYQVQKEILNAADFGVPQNRRRLFLIGAIAENGKPKVFFPFSDSVLASKKIGVTVKDAIGDLPNVDDFTELQTSDEVLLSSSQLLSMNEQSSTYVRMLRSHPSTEVNNQNSSLIFSSFPQLAISNFSYPRLWNCQFLTSSMQTQHRESTKIRFAKTLPGELESISRLRRLDLNGLCHTLRAGTDYSRGSHTSPRPIHPTLARVISVREAARLHSFPDWFRFHHTKWHGFRQVGNAVPPLLAQAIGEKIITTLDLESVLPRTFLELGNSQLLRFTFSQAKNYWEAVNSH